MITLPNRKFTFRRPVTAGDTVIPPGLANLDIANMTTEMVGLQSITTRGPAGTGFWIDWGDDTDPDWVQHLGTVTSVVTTHTYVGAGTKYQKWIGELEKITAIIITNQNYIFDIAESRKFRDLTTYNLRQNDIVGDVSNISHLTAIIQLDWYSVRYIYGNFSFLSTFSNLNFVNFGAVGSLGAGLTIDLSYFSGLTSMINLTCYNNGTTGDLSDIDALTLLTSLRINDNPLITGAIDDLDTLTNINSLFDLYNNVLLTYNTTTIPINWGVPGPIRFYSCGLSTTEVDQLFIDLDTAGGINGTCNLGGTNDPVSAASAVERANLVTNGWALTYNV